MNSEYPTLVKTYQRATFYRVGMAQGCRNISVELLTSKMESHTSIEKCQSHQTILCCIFHWIRTATLTLSPRLYLCFILETMDVTFYIWERVPSYLVWWLPTNFSRSSSKKLYRHSSCGYASIFKSMNWRFSRERFNEEFLKVTGSPEFLNPFLVYLLVWLTRRKSAELYHESFVLN